MMPSRTRALATRVLARDVCLLACAVLTGSACQSEGQAPYHDPNARLDDGGRILPDLNDPTSGDGSVRGEDAGPKQPERHIFPQTGDPMGFDPKQVYVHGRFDGGANTVTPHSLACSDGGASGFADWSSPKNDWENPNKDGITVALPCEGDDPRVRIDGSIIYEIAQFAVRAFRQEDVRPEGRHVGLPDPHVESYDPGGDPEILKCGSPKYFRHWMSPDGMIAAACYDDDGTVQPYAIADAPVTEFEIPDGYSPAHLGYDNHVLVHQIGTPKQAGVWSPDGGLKKLANLLPFAFEQVAAIRAQEDGFLLLVVNRDEDPPDLSQWHISTTGKLSKETKYPTLEGKTLDPSNCDAVFAGGAPLDGTIDPTLAINRFRSAGCECALDADGAALCIARDSKMSQFILRFEIGAQEATVAYRLEMDPFLLDFKGLVTGP